MTYHIEIKRSAQKSLAKIPEPTQNKIINRIYALANTPFPHNCKKLSGRESWRIRIGNYRVIYEIYNQELTILIIQIGHRKEVYR